MKLPVTKLSAYCSSIICPRASDLSLPYAVPATQMHRDRSGHCWCNYCTKQLAVMDWAAAHGYPFVRVQGALRYAIAEGLVNWYSSVSCAQQDMVNALYETLVEQQRHALFQSDHEDAVKRVEQFLEIVESYEEGS